MFCVEVTLSMFCVEVTLLLVSNNYGWGGGGDLSVRPCYSSAAQSTMQPCLAPPLRPATLCMETLSAVGAYFIIVFV